MNCRKRKGAADGVTSAQARRSLLVAVWAKIQAIFPPNSGLHVLHFYRSFRGDHSHDCAGVIILRADDDCLGVKTMFKRKMQTAKVRQSAWVTSTRSTQAKPTGG
jgi:hypothetical protein